MGVGLEQPFHSIENGLDGASPSEASLQKKVYVPEFDGALAVAF